MMVTELWKASTLKVPRPQKYHEKRDKDSETTETWRENMKERRCEREKDTKRERENQK